MDEQKHVSHSPGETRRIAAGLAATLSPGAVVALHGDLGSGKTCFVQGLADALGVRHGVTSPTFKLVSEHPGRIRLIHVDLYRISGEKEALGLGLEDFLCGNGITAIEWAERIARLLPDSAIHVHLSPGSRENERWIEIRGGSA
jgi:tRNA threonylcarbamoyladenosine biosynthesis protein TsaE